MDQQELKNMVGEAAAAEVGDGMHIGIGTGSTAEAFIRALAKRVNAGLNVHGVPTSERSADLCRQLGVPIGSLNDLGPLDLTIDGADEVDADLNLIKGGGGAHLREKIVASASDRVLIIVDESKIVPHLGAFPLPIEFVPFEADYTARMVQAMMSEILERDVASIQRMADDGFAFMTDSDNFIWDFHCGVINDPESLALALDTVPGLVEHGLFVELADAVMTASGQGVRTIHRGMVE